MTNVEPRVSVLVRAYNVAPWIEQCLDSILAQETSYSVEILVNDDASTDGTTEILHRYQDRYPLQVRVIFQTINQHRLGLNPASPLIAIARGEFLALCDGDDYWTDPCKLEMQTDRLDRDESLSIVMHQTDLLRENRFERRGSDGESHYKLCHFVKQMGRVPLRGVKPEARLP